MRPAGGLRAEGQGNHGGACCSAGPKSGSIAACSEHGGDVWHCQVRDPSCWFGLGQVRRVGRGFFVPVASEGGLQRASRCFCNVGQCAERAMDLGVSLLRCSKDLVLTGAAIFGGWFLLRRGVQM